ncbi:MAG: type II toxin-antitoxin system RelE/ParE family toxin [Pirellulaceae bacterium]|nr:type II toxin-antitoxin system RelE/ParE family toxin [Pirellulaceae bacterium]
MTRIVWSRRSLDDLDAIEAYIAKDHPAAARRVVQRIVKRTDRLCPFPKSGGFVEEDDHHRYRQVIQGNYRVIYRFEEASNIVFIITVIHGARLLDLEGLNVE